MCHMWEVQFGLPSLQKSDLNRPLFFVNYPVCGILVSNTKQTKTTTKLAIVTITELVKRRASL
jgi:hypothetical protein